MRLHLSRAGIALSLLVSLLAACGGGGTGPDDTRGVGLPAIDPAARSCEVLLEDDGAEVVGATFTSAVQGVHVRQAPRTAVTFFATADAPIGGDAVRLELAGDGGMTIARARCFDRDGRAIAGGGLAGGS